MGNNEMKNLVRGALLLTLSGLISKVLAAGYRIPLQNLTGDFGYYIYQQIYSILGIALVLSMYGFPSAISKITSELKSEGKPLSLKGFYYPVFIIVFGLNGVLFLLLYFNATPFALLVGDVKLASSYRLVAFIFLFIPFVALLRGVFQGLQYMKPTAYSQIGEQVIRVSTIIFIAYLFAVEKIELYQIGIGATFASIFGAIGAIVILSMFFIREKPIAKERVHIPWGYYIRVILTLGVVASLNHMILLIIQFADVFTLVPNLMKYGLTQMDAMQAKGIFDRGQPLIQLGTVLGSSFALAMIPAISKKKLKKDPILFYDNIRGTLLFSFYLSAGASIGLIIIFPEANTLLFQNTKGTASLQILSIAIFLSSVAITVSSILQGLGYFMRTAGFIVLAFLSKWLLNIILIQYWGITGSAVATVVSLFLLCLFVLFELNRKLAKVKILRYIKWKAFVISGIGMILYLVCIDFLFSFITISSRLGLLFYVMFVAITGALLYMYLLIRYRAFNEKELSLLPFSFFFIKIYKGRGKLE